MVFVFAVQLSVEPGNGFFDGVRDDGFGAGLIGQPHVGERGGAGHQEFDESRIFLLFKKVPQFRVHIFRCDNASAADGN